MLYQREPVIPVDVDVNNNSNSEFLKDEDMDYDLDEVTFSKTIQAMLDLRGKHKIAIYSIKFKNIFSYNHPLVFIFTFVIDDYIFFA